MELDRANATLPLEDLQVIGLAQAVAGPFATMLLADLGAEVVKVEPVRTGDTARHVPPIPKYFEAMNRNKRTVSVDLKSEEGQEVVYRLLDDADVFVENAKMESLEDFDLTAERVFEREDHLVYCSIKGFGRGSPYEGRPAWDLIVQAMSGIMSLAGERDGPPMWSGLLSGDLIPAMYSVQAIVAALYAVERGDIEREYIEVPMLDSAVSWLTVRASHTFGTGEKFPRDGSQHPTMTPFGTFECSDGTIVVGASTDSLFERFCRAIDREDLLEDERFETLAKRVEHRDDLLPKVEPVLAERACQEWLDTFGEYGVPAGAINDTKTVWEDEHVQQRNLHRTIEKRDGGTADVIDNPVRFANLGTEIRLPPPELGADTDDVLERYGYTSEEIARLRADGVDEWEYDWEPEYLAGTTDLIFRNTFGDLEVMLTTMADHDTRPCLECYDVGHLYNLRHCVDRGLLDPPFHVEFVLGITGGIGADPENLVHMKRVADSLFDEFSFSVIGAGRSQFEMAAQSVAMGGHARVGLEDNLYLERGRLAASNAKQVSKVVDLAWDVSGREPADPEEVREFLDLKGPDRTAF